MGSRQLLLPSPGQGWTFESFFFQTKEIRGPSPPPNLRHLSPPFSNGLNKIGMSKVCLYMPRGPFKTFCVSKKSPQKYTLFFLLSKSYKHINREIIIGMMVQWTIWKCHQIRKTKNKYSFTITKEVKCKSREFFSILEPRVASFSGCVTVFYSFLRWLIPG